MDRNYCSEGVGGLRMVSEDEDALLEVGPCRALREDKRAGGGIQTEESCQEKKKRREEV